MPTPQIDKLLLERLTIEPDEKALDEQIKQLASQSKRWSDAPKKHEAAIGDLVVMDFEGKVGGKPFEGGKGEDMSVELGSGRLIPGFEDQLVGAKAGDKREVKLSFPADYPADEPGGQGRDLRVEVKGVKIAGETKLDDEFAKSLGLQDLDQLKGLIRDQHGQELNGLTRTHMKRQLLDQLAARHDFEVPDSMVEAEFRTSSGSFARRRARRPTRRRRWPRSRRIRTNIAASRNGACASGCCCRKSAPPTAVEVTEQEMNRLVADAASQYQGKDRDTFLRYVQQEPMFAAQIRAPLYEDKVVDYLFSTADVTERKATRAELEADLESEEGHVHGPGCGHDHAAPASPREEGRGQGREAGQG